MNNKLYMLRGLPASGKTTWAKERIKEASEKGIIIKRVNKDDLRAMLDNGRHSKANEAFVCEARDCIVIASLMDGYDVIVDDTNLHPKHEARLRELATDADAGFIDVSFVTPVAECLRRDAEREKPVGEKVINRMNNQSGWMLKINPFSKANKNFAIIVDIDGTVAHMNGRSPYDSTKVLLDAPDPVVVDLVKQLHKQNYADIIFVSGREGNKQCYLDTEAWLNEHMGFNDYDLHMRLEGDSRPDFVVKKEIYENLVEPTKNVLFVLDDRNQVVNMWRNELGLTCLQVADGNF